jgi:solute carrier family 36 (proton-coupled amino acid transporter)
MMILVPISWVRNISKFSFTFLIGNSLILATLIIVTVVLSVRLYDNGHFGKDIVPLNKNEFWSMVGFSCYAYEGIGVVMPIMSACECPEKFDKILFYALLTLTVVYCLFGNFCYLVIGTDLDTTFITQELDPTSKIVSILQVMMSLNLVCSYAIMIYPTNTIIEDYMYRSFSKKKDTKSKKIYYWV